MPHRDTYRRWTVRAAEKMLPTHQPPSRHEPCSPRGMKNSRSTQRSQRSRRIPWLFFSAVSAVFAFDLVTAFSEQLTEFTESRVRLTQWFGPLSRQREGVEYVGEAGGHADGRIVAREPEQQ